MLIIIVDKQKRYLWIATDASFKIFPMYFKRTYSWQLRPAVWRVSRLAVLPGNVSFHEKPKSDISGDVLFGTFPLTMRGLRYELVYKTKSVVRTERSVYCIKYCLHTFWLWQVTWWVFVGCKESSGGREKWERRNEVTTSENWVGRGVEMNHSGMMVAQHPKRGKSQCLSAMRQNEKIEFAFSLNETSLRVVDQVLMKTV